jgi:excinuclease ABC subunit C
VYLVRRGTVRAESAAPRSTPDRFELQRRIDQVFQPGEPDRAAVRLHEIDEILLLSSWFRRFPDELARTWRPTVT